VDLHQQPTEQDSKNQEEQEGRLGHREDPVLFV